MSNILNYMRNVNYLAKENFIGQIICSTMGLDSPVVLSNAETDKVIKKFFAITKFDTISAKQSKYNPDVILHINLDIDNNIITGQVSAIEELYKYFPKSEHIYPHLNNYISSLQGINIALVLKQNLLTLNLLDSVENASKFVDFLAANKAFNTYPSKFNIANDASLYILANFFNEHQYGTQDVSTAQIYFDSLFYNTFGINKDVVDFNSAYFNTLMRNIYNDFGFGSWKLDLNITCLAGNFIVDQANYNAFRKAFVQPEQWAELMDKVSEYYKIELYNNDDMPITLGVKLYKDIYGITVFTN